MTKNYIVIIIISFIFSFINLCLAIWVQIKGNNLYKITSEDSYLQYEYLNDILIISYLKLLITASSFDIVYFLLYFFLNVCICNNNEDNLDDVKIKNIQEQKISNLVIEFLFFILIKGIALGFGVFYSIEIIDETKRIIDDKSNPQNDKQLQLLKNIKIISYFMKWIVILTIIYLIGIYLFRFYTFCLLNESKSNEIKTYNIKEIKIDEERSLSLEEIGEINNSVIKDEKTNNYSLI